MANNISQTPLPSMDPEGFKLFCTTLSSSKCYLEFGSGASTNYATNVAKVPVVISVDSDPKWCHSVRENTYSSFAGKCHVEYCDLGTVGEWGMPLDKSGVDNFWRYMDTPWLIARNNGYVPDVILIDGRFRVASFLYSLICSRPGTKILFDDYFDREHYFCVEEFSPVFERHGRMALFYSLENYPIVSLCQKIAQYSIIPF
jgi:hypothetical protein